MSKELQALIEVSDFFGVDKEYVIAGGGNTSYKNEDTLWVKASGVALAGIAEDGFVKMSREKLTVLSEKQYSNDSSERESQVKDDMLKAVLSENGLRPSVETSLHDIVRYPFVVHTHPTLVNALTCSNNAEEKCYEVLGSDIMYIPYIDPGYVLFKFIANALDEYRKTHDHDPQVIVLENHGIIVSADTTDEIKSIYKNIESNIKAAAKTILPDTKLVSFNSSFREDALSIYGSEMDVKLINNQLIADYIKDETLFKAVQTAFTPDHIVYCKARYLFVNQSSDLKKEIADFKVRYGYQPKIIAIENKGLMIIDDTKEATSIICDLIQNMMKIDFYARAFEGAKPMNDTQIAFIENWEAENYRKKMAENK